MKKVFLKIFAVTLILEDAPVGDELLCGIADQRKAFNLISNRDHCQRSSTSRISDTHRTGFEPAQNLSSSFDE